MRYLGGKDRIAKELSIFLESIRGGRKFVEPFCGGLSITRRMTGLRSASNACKPLITLYKALQQGWVPPDCLDREEYDRLRGNMNEENPLTGFAGFGCSWGGKWFGGFAYDSTGRNYCKNAKNSLLKKMSACMDVSFTHCSYDALKMEDAFIYCDPPYRNTTVYAGVKPFDSDLFWSVVRKWSERNIVVVSEYEAPKDFKSIWERKTKTDLFKHERVEKLFIFA